MLRAIKCYNCKEEVKANPKLKGNQHYCRKAECQLARKRLWQKNKMKRDKSYRTSQTGYVKQWCKKKPFDLYMKQYRQSHPEYLEINRREQKRRNDSRKQWTEQSKDKKIVKMDTLIVQLKQIQSVKQWENYKGV